MKTDSTTIEIARAAIRHLAEQRLPLTPENYAIAWMTCGGAPPAVDAAGHAEALRRLERTERAMAELQRLLLALCDSVGTLSDDGTWLHGQMSSMRALLESGADRRAVSAARQLIEQTAITQQHVLDRKRDALVQLRDTLAQVTEQTADLGSATDDFGQRVKRWAGDLETADSPEALDEIVRGLAADARAMHANADRSHERLATTHDRAQALQAEVDRLERELAEASQRMLTDHLTQTLNRRGLEEAWQAAMSRARRSSEPLSLALLDVDDFKKLNDAFGHLAGDGALKHLARLLQARLRPGDSVARFGGEEFLLLLPNSRADGATRAMQRLQRELTSDVYLFENRQVFLTFSAGVTEAGVDDGFEAVVTRADDALYKAKRAGKNCVVAA